jgi:Fur family peroxide stress response transcriptional regulator
MSLTEQKARYRFKEAGLKMTPQRMAVFRVMEGNSSHPSADDIYREVKKDYPNTSMATIYNTLELLKELGLIRELTIEPDRRHFDPDASAHHHIICTRCRRIEDIFEELPEVTRLPASVKAGFSLEGYNVEFYGVCKACSSK